MISLLEQQMTNANVSKASTIADTAIRSSVNQRKQNRHRGIKERLQRLFGHIHRVREKKRPVAFLL